MIGVISAEQSFRIPYVSWLKVLGDASYSIYLTHALTLFVAPVLLDSAYDDSPRDIKRNWATVASLAIIAVGVTTAAVAIVARWLVPDMPWPVAIALGAVVAPPDAA